MDKSYITTGISVGDYVYGTGVTDGTTITAVNVGNNPLVLTLSAAMSITDGRELTFITPTNEVAVTTLANDAGNLVAGTYITGVSTGNLTGTPIVLDIDIANNKLTLSSEQAFANNTTLTFQARGSNMIKESTGVDIDFSNFNSNTISATSAELTKRVRAAVSNQTITLDNTYGVAGGGFVTVSGVGVINTSANTVQVVNSDVDGSNGYATVQVTQALKAGSKIYFTGSAEKITIANTIKINSHPTANIIVYLNLDNFITPGISGA